MEMIKVQMQKNYFMALDQEKRKILENIDGSMNIEILKTFVKKYLNTNGISSLGGTSSPKKETSTAILSKTLRKISPKYIPEVNFSNIWKNKWTS